MSSPPKVTLTPLILTLIVFFTATTTVLTSPTTQPDPTPTPWPLQFHSILYVNNTKTAALQKVDLYYDYPNGRNFNIIQKQLGELLYDLEWDNGTSFYYTLDENKKCRVLHFEVGILRPNWLDGAEYVGREVVDTFECNVWKKVDFITYYEDVVTKRPVSWEFFTGMTAHVMTFEVGKVLQDAGWQAPVYCFAPVENEPKKSLPEDEAFVGPFGRKNLLNDALALPM